ncbi:MAG: hypothetical protein AB7K09_21165 [Planctomycetota bacterium]
MTRRTRTTPTTLALLLGASMLLLLAAPHAPAQPGPGPDSNASAASPDRLRELIAQLGADSHVERRRAEARLQRIGRAALPLLMTALADSKDAEVTFRVQTILTAIGEDFLVLCSHLSDRNPRVRGYAEESLTLRLLGSDPAMAGGPEPPPINDVRESAALLHNPVNYAIGNLPRRPTPLVSQRLNLPGDTFEGSANDLLGRINNDLPVLIMPEAWGTPALHQPLSLARPQVANVEAALSEFAAQRGIAYGMMMLGRVPVLVIGLQASSRRLTVERDVALGLCECTQHDLPEARAAAFRRLGLIYGNRESVTTMLVNSAQLDGNPQRDALLDALVHSGQPMDQLLGDVPAWAVEAVRRQLANPAASWISRMAAARALVTWTPREPREGATRTARQREEFEAAQVRYAAARTAFHERVVPALIAAAGGDDALASYLAVWALGALRDGVSDEDRALAVTAIAGALASPSQEIARQALQALAWMAPDPPPPGTLDRALELGHGAAGDQSLRDAALGFLRRSRSPELFAAVLKRFGEVDATDATTNALRMFLAQLLSDATDVATLDGLLKLLATEPSDEVAEQLIHAFNEKVTDAALWPPLMTLLMHEHPVQRRRGARILVSCGLPDREAKVRRLLDGAKEDIRKVELQIILFRLGTPDLLQVLLDVFNSDDENLSREAAIGLGETMSDDVLEVFRNAFNEPKVTTRLAALHGLDAWGRACAAAGNVEKVSQAYQTLFNFSRDPSTTVRDLARTVRNNYASGQAGYRVESQRVRAAARPDGAVATYTMLPARPDKLTEAAAAGGGDGGGGDDGGGKENEKPGR